MTTETYTLPPHHSDPTNDAAGQNTNDPQVTQTGANSFNRHVADLVNLGWTPQTVTADAATLTNRGPFSWVLFLLATFFLPVLGGLLYLAFWSVLSRATVFLHRENGGVAMSGDTWLVDRHKDVYARLEADRRDVRDRGYLRVMWPRLAMTTGLFLVWLSALTWIMQSMS